MEEIHYEQLDETFFKKELENGLSVFLLPKRQRAKSYAIFMTDYGSMHNTFTPLNQQERITVPDGIAHFLEHKLFEKEDHDVFTDFMKLGASPTAYTFFTKLTYSFFMIEYVV